MTLYTILLYSCGWLVLSAPILLLLWAFFAGAAEGAGRKR
jgi:hypothetical protein